MQDTNSGSVSATSRGRSLSAVFSKRVLFLGTAGLTFIILLGLVIHASYFNTDKYYLKVAAGAIEIWQGTFSPGGEKTASDHARSSGPE